MKTIKIKVPATTANLGSGFDSFGVALNLYNEIEIEQQSSRAVEQKLRIEIEGEGKDTLPRDEKNIVWKAMKKVFIICKRPLTTYHLRLTNRIPLASGLGSSAATTLGGLLLANKICYNKLSDEEILKLAVKIEGHPDNIIPAFAGGFCICYGDDNLSKTAYAKLEMPADLRAVLCIPEFEFKTAYARKILPKKAPLKSAVFNLSRSALFICALLKKNYKLFDSAMEDALHQRYRGKYIPGIDDVFRAAKKSGASGVCISGSGPTIIALSSEVKGEKLKVKSERIGTAMKKAFASRGIKSRVIICDFDKKGAAIL